MQIGQAKNLEMCIIFSDTPYQFLSFDCDIIAAAVTFLQL